MHQEKTKNMPKSRWNFLILTTLILSATIATACSTTTTPAMPSGPVTLKITVLPILDALPMYVAQEEGLFDTHGVQVEFIPVASAPERDQIITAGRADGMINETVSTVLYNKDDLNVQTVRIARAATADAPVFHILASAQSDITSVDSLKNRKIGISHGTVIEYLTERLLQAEGFTPDEINTIAVPKIPDRLALLNSGELPAATLPDPLTFLAIQQGAVNVLDDSSHPEYGYSTISFRKEVIDQHPEAIRAFLAALEEAVVMINQDPTKWDSLLTEQKLVPAPLVGSYQINPYPTASVPSQEQWQDVLDWAKEKGLVGKDLPYSESINSSFLP
jgi:NitT/TauT family transport system substrate-binding protein